MLLQRTEQHIIDRQSIWYKMLEQKCHNAKNIYNHGNYLIRQEFIKNGKWLRYVEVEQLVKNNLEYPDYWNWKLANSGQQVLRQLDNNWKSFFKAIKDWSKHKEKYTGKPKLPKYLKKDGLCEFALTNIHAKLKSDNIVHFPKSMDGFTIKPQFIYDERFVKFNVCRVVPRNDRIVIELVYTIEVEDKPLEKTGKIGSIDLGIDNFATFVNNVGFAPIIINGKGLKSCNKYYNKLVAKAKSELDLNKNKQKYSHRLYSITNKRNDKVKHYMHQASKYIVDLCQALEIATLVVGKNDSWKQESNMGKVNNQTFVQIPYQIFINNLTYKCQEARIILVLTEESYTSGTSFLDNELPIKENYDKSRRIRRGLFKSSKGLINADVNAAYQIMKKVFCDAEMPADRGFVLNPVRVNICF